ncbi:MAG: hypothetical protein JWP52_2281 [Rhizobacter sp.]|nr:hypothetical protein [Rhizobacter sp.]
MPLVNQPAQTQPPSAPKRRLSRGTIWALGTLAVIVLALALGEIAGWPFLRGPVERKLTEAMQRQVTLGDGFRVRFLGSLRVRTDTLAVAPPDWDTGKSEPSPFVNATDAYLKVPYSTLWGLYRKSEAPVRIAALEVGDLQARLLREEGGRANWALKPESDEPKAAMAMPQFDRLILKSGHVVFDDAQTQVQFDATARTNEGTAVAGSADSQPASGASAAQGEAASGTPASGAASATTSASASAASASDTFPMPSDPNAPGLYVEGKGSYKKNPLTFQIGSDGALPLLASDTSKTSVRLNIDARAGKSRLKFNGRAVDVFRFTGVDGQYDVAGPSLAAIGDAVGVTLPTTAAFAMNGSLRKQGKLWTTNVRSLTVGTSKLNGEFKFDQNANPPLLTGQLNGPRLALADLGPAVGAGASKGAPNPPPSAGKVLPQRNFDIPSLKAMDADVKVRLAQADLGSDALQPFAPLQGDLTLRQGVLSIDNLLASTSGGDVRGSLKLDSSSATPKFGADIRWAGVKLEQWLKLTNPRDAKAKEGGKPPPYVTGDAIGNARLSGQGKSTADIIGSLNGTVSTGIRNGTLSHLVVEAAGLDIAQAVGMLFKGDEGLKMNCALIHLTAKNGVANTDVGIIDTSDTTLLITGQVSFAKETLGLTLTAKPKDMSPLTLRAPLKVNGTFADPSVRPDTQSLAIKGVGAALLALINPIAAVIPLIDLGDKSASAGCEEAVARLRTDPTTRTVTAPPAKRAAR